MSELGKYTDAGKVVYGGGVDRHWIEAKPEEHYKEYFDKRPNFEYLFDSELALKTFDLRSVEFGNWMTQQDRANFLYASTMALTNLAQILKVNLNQIGFGGILSLSLGARGRGGNAAAHYEPYTRTVINIAKTVRNGETFAKGKGAVAHEFAHAFDNVLSRGLKLNQSFLSGGDSVRKSVDENLLKNGNIFEQQFEEVFKILYWTPTGKETDFQQKIEATENEYLNRREEVWARTFEAYIYYKLKKANRKDNFLVKSSYKNDKYPSETLIKKVTPIIDKILKDGFKVIGSAGLAGIAKGVSGYDGFRKVIKRNGNLDDTIAHIKLMAERDAHTVANLAYALEGSTVAETAENIWDYLRSNTAYKLDKDGIEELRTPLASLYDGKRGLTDDRYGIDCDDYTILILALLQVLQIRGKMKVTAYQTKGKFEHIYPVAIDENGNEYVIDCVPEIDYFNQEAHPIIDLKTVEMEIHELSGLGTTQAEAKADLIEDLNQPFELGGIGNMDTDDILDAGFLNGLEEVDNPEDADIVLSGAEANSMIETGLLAEVLKAKEALYTELENPTALSQTIDVNGELSRLEDLAEAWEDEEERADIIAEAVTNQSAYANFYKGLMFSLNELEMELNGIDDDDEIYLARVDLSEMMDDEDLGATARELIRARRKSNRASRKGRLKKLFQKVGAKLKKGVKAVVRYAPHTVALRNSALLSLKTNVLGVASRLIYGYLSESEARAQGLDIGEWRKIRQALETAEKGFEKIGGKAKNFRNAIIKGRARKVTGIQLNGLGALPAFLVPVVTLLKKINPLKLLKRKKNKTPEEQAMIAEESGNPAPTSDPVDTLPEETDPDMMEEEEGEEEEEPSTWQKAKNWVQENKGTAIGGGIGLIVIVIAVVLFVRKRKKLLAKHDKTVAGLKGAITRERNKHKRKPSKTRKRVISKRSNTTRKTKRKSTPKKKQLGSGKSNPGNRLGMIHAKARELQKKHPKTAYSQLMSKASKMV